MNNKQLRTIITIGVAIIVVGILAYVFYPRGEEFEGGNGTPAADEESEVRKVVDDFGRALKNVSLLAPDDALSSSIRASYSQYLAPALLDDWVNSPDRAIGREVSSPWPDRIDIQRVQVVSDEEYLVSGDVIEVTSATNILGGEAAARQDIDLSVRLIEDRWLISGVTLGAYELDTGTWQSYTDEENDIRFRFPADLNTTYISLAESPSPSISVTTGSLDCEETAAGATGMREVDRRTISERAFCVSAQTQGAAGSVFTEYTYETEFEGRLISANFTLRYPQCENYDESERELCLSERERFDVDAIIGQAADTLELAE